jgi:hypothetical protein
MEKTIGQISRISLEEVPLNPWTEYVGRVVDITDSGIILETVYRVLIPISPEVLSKGQDEIQKGNDVAILALDDGNVSVRKVASC